MKASEFVWACGEVIVTGTSHRFERKVEDCVKDRDALYIPPDSLATAVSQVSGLSTLLQHELKVSSPVAVGAIFDELSITLLLVVESAADPPDHRRLPLRRQQ